MGSFHNFRKSNPDSHEYFDGKHRLEHWYRDNQVYFITARTRDGVNTFLSDEACKVFWDRFEHYTEKYGFVPWVTSLLSNHYHTIGYLYRGIDLGPMMQKLHGSVAKLVNDILPTRHLPFWRETAHAQYFDGCIRDELQARRAYRYTLTQSTRHKLVSDYRTYPHTHVNVDIDRAVKRALELDAFLTKLPYPRYKK
jgi:hypothetical protein